MLIILISLVSEKYSLKKKKIARILVENETCSHLKALFKTLRSGDQKKCLPRPESNPVPCLLGFLSIQAFRLSRAGGGTHAQIATPQFKENFIRDTKSHAGNSWQTYLVEILHIYHNECHSPVFFLPLSPISGLQNQRLQTYFPSRTSCLILWRTWSFQSGEEFLQRFLRIVQHYSIHDWYWLLYSKICACHVSSLLDGDSFLISTLLYTPGFLANPQAFCPQLTALHGNIVAVVSQEIAIF